MLKPFELSHVENTYRVTSRIEKMLRFQLAKEIEKDIFFVLSRAWDREEISSPHEKSNLKFSDSALRCFTTEPQRLFGGQGSYMTSVLHTATIRVAKVNKQGTNSATNCPFDKLLSSRETMVLLFPLVFIFQIKFYRKRSDQFSRVMCYE